MINHIETIKVRLREGEFTSEAAVSQGILLPTLHQLGWPVFDTKVVVPEFSIEGLRVDFALCHPANRPSVFIEVKKVGQSDGADRQLFEYAFHLGVPMAILTDGQEWSFYLPGEQGRYEERRVYQPDLLERSTEETASRLERYLSYKRVCSGDALTAARSDYQNVARSREIDATFPKAWNALLEEQDSLLLELLAEKVEDLCGYKPDMDVCSQFLEKTTRQTYNSKPANAVQEKSTVARPTSVLAPSRTRIVDHFTFTFKDRVYEAGSAREVMTKIFQLLASEDHSFLDRFAARKHGKKRRYLAKVRSELYPGRPDLAEEHSVQIAPGWWMGTNYSRRDIQKILNLAIEVTIPMLRSVIKVNVE